MDEAWLHRENIRYAWIFVFVWMSNQIQAHTTKITQEQNGIVEQFVRRNTLLST